MYLQRARRTQGDIKEELRRAAFNYDPERNYAQYVHLGAMDNECQKCHALKFQLEPIGLCCCDGKIRLPVLVDPEEPLRSLLLGEHPNSGHFLNNIRSYNSCFQMTSFGATEMALPGFMPTFRVQGQVYHRIGSLMPLQNEQHQFLQIYFIGDEQAQAERRHEVAPLTRRPLIEELQTMLHRCNPYVQSIVCAMERLADDPTLGLHIRPDRRPQGEAGGRYNSPAADEVAIVIVGQQFNRRDIVIQQRDHLLRRVSETHRSYDALQYPLLFSHGEDGYNLELYMHHPDGTPRGEGERVSRVSCMNFYAYRLMVRRNEGNYLLRGARLLLQYQVDMFAKMETERLNWERHNQTTIRAADYQDLRDAFATDGDAAQVGRRIVLPATYTGSDRYFHEREQDAMSYVSKFGRPDLFITVTCNPKWPEIQENLFAGQAAHDRHDIIARVFYLKVKQLLQILHKYELFGRVNAYSATIEWQKRGLPHIHLLLFLQERPRAAEIDSIISAELPDPDTDGELFELVKRHMIHGPCGALNQNSPCMKDGKCQKRFPKRMVPETIHGEDSYPLYRRRSQTDGGNTTVLPVRGHDTVVDNRWIVPYNPVLLRLFETHINVEYCHSVKAIKYICKYIHKGSDQAAFELELDEISHHQNGRYVSSNESCWRLFEFPIHRHHPAVVQLAVHLENGQRVYFNERNMRDRVQTPPKSTLTAFMELCSTDDFAQSLLYKDAPLYYTWKAKKWHRRLRGTPVDGHPGIFKEQIVSRVYTVHPRQNECYYLRILLHHVVGPKKFEDLRTVDGEVMSTYREACLRRGLLADDAHWSSTLEEACLTQNGSKVRHLFAMMLAMCELAHPRELWEAHKDGMCDDILRRRQRVNPEASYDNSIYNEGLQLLDEKVRDLTGRSIVEFGLPEPEVNAAYQPVNEVQRELNYNQEHLAEILAERVGNLVEDQLTVYQTVTEKLANGEGGLIFLDAPGGTGKTFLLNLLLAKVRQGGEIALAVASSGIAATLLEGGKTAHSMFKLPLSSSTDDNPVCNICKGTYKAELLRRCKLIVWDECTMSHKSMFEAVDRTLRDIRNTEQIMGGMLVVLAGDFRQTLPVVPRGTPADEIKACLKSSPLWNRIQILRLQTNMRVHLHGDHTAGEFAQTLLSIGDGRMPVNVHGEITLDESLCITADSVEQLINNVYPEFETNITNLNWLTERVILAPRNDDVDKINLRLLHLSPGEESLYSSFDAALSDDDAAHFPLEFLNQLQPTGFPPHQLRLKVGVPVMMLRNLDPPKLCNGTRLIITQMHPNVIEAKILTGSSKGELVMIPRIPFLPIDDIIAFKRIQYPLRVCYAMTINKSQGQTLKVAGLNLEAPVFSHGQLYVGCSRVSRSMNLIIHSPTSTTRNVVYPNVLTTPTVNQGVEE